MSAPIGSAFCATRWGIVKFHPHHSRFHSRFVLKIVAWSVSSSIQKSASSKLSLAAAKFSLGVLPSPASCRRHPQPFRWFTTPSFYGDIQREALFFMDTSTIHLPLHAAVYPARLRLLIIAYQSEAPLSHKMDKRQGLFGTSPTLLPRQNVLNAIMVFWSSVPLYLISLTHMAAQSLQVLQGPFLFHAVKLRFFSDFVLIPLPFSTRSGLPKIKTKATCTVVTV